MPYCLWLSSLELKTVFVKVRLNGRVLRFITELAYLNSRSDQKTACNEVRAGLFAKQDYAATEPITRPRASGRSSHFEVLAELRHGNAANDYEASKHGLPGEGFVQDDPA